MENRKLVVLTLIFGALAVTLGAFGAHGLKPYMDEAGISNFQTANRYHFYHVFLALFIVLFPGNKNKASNLAIVFALIGIVLFSGSLYVMALNKLIHYPGWFPILTPLGGLCFIIAWTLLIFHFVRSVKI
ncbi:MAG: DUF423 domain-containing protein [Saprospiraceae bacterium]